jgi:hypothetical protein
MIKPDFWNDEKLASISDKAKLLFIGMWNFSDDYAVVRGSNVWLKSQIFPYEESLTSSQVEGFVKELKQIGCISIFHASGERYIFIKNFTKHQRIDKKSKTRNPEPPTADDLKKNGSGNDGGDHEIPLPEEPADIDSDSDGVDEMLDSIRMLKERGVWEKQAKTVAASVNRSFLERKLEHFDYLKETRGEDITPAYLLGSIEHDYAVPKGFDEWHDRKKLEAARSRSGDGLQSIGEAMQGGLN